MMSTATGSWAAVATAGTGTGMTPGTGSFSVRTISGAGRTVFMGIPEAGMTGITTALMVLIVAGAAIMRGEGTAGTGIVKIPYPSAMRRGWSLIPSMMNKLKSHSPDRPFHIDH